MKAQQKAFLNDKILKKFREGLHEIGEGRTATTRTQNRQGIGVMTTQDDHCIS